ncbi:MAG: DEAD/DEAH box helicase [Thermoflexibacter sp.]|jgi:ATP-dependent RNA helicase DeaD|nr:DEAD/DEAH box helicase [Thermoflexibacter sp.]
MENLTFDELGLSIDIMSAIAELGFTTATPIQSQAIPVALTGRDILGQAQTGTGKTAAFGLPLLEKIDTSLKKPQAIVLCPTRELAVQVCEELKKFAKNTKGLHVVAIFGGDSMERQLRELRRGVQVIVGTPGRLIDHLGRGSFETDNIDTVVLDEADEMLNMGFVEDIEHIFDQLPSERQTLLFSATMPPPILTLTKKYLNNPHHVKVVKSTVTAASIKQYYFNLKGNQKVEVMARLMEVYDLKLMLVFCNTKKQVDDLVALLQLKGLEAEGIHGDLKQSQRTSVMAKFKSNVVNILVATDVAARGIDVSGVDAVFNYDIPLDPEYYVHRIGRTGRAGKSGMSFTFVTGRESSKLKEIERFTKSAIERGKIPSEREIQEVRQQKFAGKLKEEITKGGLERYSQILNNLLKEELDIQQIAAALIRMNLGDMRQLEEIETNFIGADEPKYATPKMTRLFINIGKNQRISKGDILGAITGETGIKGKMIGDIEILEKFSFVDVAETEVKKVLRIMGKNTIKGRRINLEVAKN